MGRKSRKSLIIPCTMLCVLLSVAIGKAVSAQHFQNQLTILEQEKTDFVPAFEEVAVLENERGLLPDTGAATHRLQAVDLKDGLQIHFGGGQIVNILLVGQDAAGDSGARSDTMILCTFNKKENTITMTSFLRDLYVKIPGHRSNRINAAYRFGGTKLLGETLYENFGVQIDGNVQVDFDRFEQIIDSLGGVTIELTAAEAGFVNEHVEGSELTEGAQLLTGRQALMYARNRYDTDGDFSRTNRQRKLLSALLQAYRGKNLTQMLALIQEIRPMITTDISKTDLTAYAVTLLPMLPDAEIRTQAIPVDGGYSYKNIDGKSVLVPDMQKNIQALEDTLS